MTSMARRQVRTAMTSAASWQESAREDPSDARPGFATLTLGSIGVVYGDVGTSPLYAFRKAVLAATDSGGAVTPEAVIGTLSLILWALLLIVTAKYVLLLLRADNNGEGGVLALMALGQRALRSSTLITVLGIMGAGFFYGDALITPAISVLSAVEGLKLATPAFGHFVLPLTVAILVALFAFQARGTAKVAALFGPIIALWFLALAVAGVAHIADNLQVLRAINPMHGIVFLASHGQIGLVTLGAVFLAVTGAEALYPEWALLPMVGLATAASVIASQAVITGAYSLSRQAIQLGLLPRLEIRHTSEAQAGQIYIPRVTGALLVGVLLLVGLFRTSTALASAYGIAVATTMIADGLLGFIVIWKYWHWPLWRVGLVMAPLVIVDVVFFSANLLKLFEGAWAPILFGASMVLLILTWRRGTSILARKTRRTEVPLDTLLASLQKHPPHIVPGTAIFLTSQPEFAPTALLHNLKHNKVLHERNLI